jgi:hypothetical protein
MYSEQLAILLLIAANGLNSQANINAGPTARVPHGGTEQVSVNLKLDPRLNSYRNPYTRKIVQRKTSTSTAVLASAY